MNEFPQSYRPVLELAEQGILLSDVPDDLAAVLERCRKRRLLKLKKEQVPDELIRTKQKKASSLQPGEWIQTGRGDGSRVLGVSRFNSSETAINVMDAGASFSRLFTALSDRQFNVFVGEPPGDYRKRLVLTPDGQDALDLLREASPVPASAQLETASTTGTQDLKLENGATVKPDDVPAEFRDEGKLDGEILTAPFLKKSIDWQIRSERLSEAYGTTLTRRVMVKNNKRGQNPYAYLYTELLALRDSITRSQDE